MSRYSFDQNEGGSLAIGWDPGMGTFFLQLDEDEEQPSVWAGNEFGQYVRPDELVTVARLASGEVPDDMTAILLTDQIADPSWLSIDERFADASMDLTVHEVEKMPVRMPRSTTFRSLWRRITGK